MDIVQCPDVTPFVKFESQVVFFDLKILSLTFLKVVKREGVICLLSYPGMKMLKG